MNDATKTRLNVRTEVWGTMDTSVGIPADSSMGMEGPNAVLLSPDVGALRLEHYTVLTHPDGSAWELGRGAMGVTYKAFDTRLQCAVALKVIHSSLLQERPVLRERFLREARIAARVRHPNIASVYHLGEVADGHCFYAMELVEGETLAELVRRRGPLPALLVLDIALQVTHALVAAGQADLIHRDLKPANIMLATGGSSSARPGRGVPGSTPGSRFDRPEGSAPVKVIDFGLARSIKVSADDQPLTVVGDFMGTPQYASPEQLARDDAPIDIRSDIFSLGSTLWFLLTAQHPYSGRSLEEIYRQQLRTLPVGQLHAANVPEQMVTLLNAMLAFDPADRPQSPLALLDALRRCHNELGPVPDSTLISQPPRRRKRPRWLPGVAVAALLLVAAAGAGVALWRTRPAAPPPAVVLPEKSIAVLPLEDRSEDKSNAYFATGIQDDLICSLAAIKDLKVISRSSVMGYRDPAKRNLREISQQLGIVHVLEGSVRRAADRVVVNVALIDTRNGVQLWAEQYDRTLTDALTLQGELATEIAASLRANLSPEEKARVEAKPTNNAEAYALYLHGRDYQTRPNILLQDHLTAERFYTQALALDPSFALAHARLAATLAYIHFNFQPSKELHDRALAAAAEALRLQPQSGQSVLAHALCLYWTEKDYEGALRELEVAARLLPNSSEIDRYTGGIRRRQGRWRDALASMRRALALDPRDAQTAREILRTDCLLRDWPSAERDGLRAVSVAPDNLLLRLEKGSVDYWHRGDLAPVRAILATIPPGIDPDGEVTFGRWDLAMATRDFDAAERVVATSGQERIVTQFGISLPKDYFVGCAALARGDEARARPLLERALAPTEAQARELPQDAYRQARLGLLNAYAGRKEEAIRLGLRATELMPETRDAYLGPSVSAMLTLIYARTGETDQAIALVDRLIRTPGGLMPAFEANITQSDLRHRWQWDPLRKDPRFQALVADPEPKVVYK